MGNWANEVALLDGFPHLLSYMEKMYSRPRAPPRIAEALASVHARTASSQHHFAAQKAAEAAGREPKPFGLPAAIVVVVALRAAAAWRPFARRRECPGN